MRTMEKEILEDGKIDKLLILHNQVQKTADIIRSAAADRIAYLAGAKSTDEFEQLSGIYDKMIDDVEICRRIMISELYPDENQIFSDINMNAPFDAVSIKPEDLKWFIGNVKVAEKDNVLKISLPLLMPHRKLNARDRYIDALMDIGLMHFVDFNGIKPMPFQEALIAFSHTYDSTHRHYVKDHDNIEVKHCIDRIAQYFITSDSGFDCQLYHRSQMGSECRTDIFVMDHETAKKHLFDVFEWDFGV